MKIAGYNSAAGWVAGVVGVHPWQADLFIAASGPEAEDRWLSRAIGADGRALQDFRDRLEFVRRNDYSLSFLPEEDINPYLEMPEATRMYSSGGLTPAQEREVRDRISRAVVCYRVRTIEATQRYDVGSIFAPELFRDRAFPLALLQGFLVMLPRLGAVTVAGLWFQGVAGDSAALSAVKIIGFPLGLTIGSLAGDRISRIWPPRPVLALSAAVATGGMGLLLANARTGETWVTVIGLGVMGLGNGVFQTLNSSLIMTSTPRGRTGVVNSIRVMVQAFGTGAGLALSMALIVAFATADQARLFLSGDAAALGAGRAAIDAGFAAAYGTFFVLMALGTAATLVRPRRRP